MLLLRCLGGGRGLRLLLLLYQRRDLTLFLGQRTLLGLYGLRILRHGVLLRGHLRLGLRLLVLELGLLEFSDCSAVWRLATASEMSPSATLL